MGRQILAFVLMSVLGCNCTFRSASSNPEISKSVEESECTPLLQESNGWKLVDYTNDFLTGEAGAVYVKQEDATHKTLIGIERESCKAPWMLKITKKLVKVREDSQAEKL